MYSLDELKLMDKLSKDRVHSDFIFMHLPSGKFLGIQAVSAVQKINELYQLGIGCSFYISSEGYEILLTPNLSSDNLENHFDVLEYLKQIKPYMPVSSDDTVRITGVWFLKDYNAQRDGSGSIGSEYIKFIAKNDFSDNFFLI